MPIKQIVAIWVGMAVVILAADQWAKLGAWSGQSEPTPPWLDGFTPPPASVLVAHGWRLWDGTEPAVPDGQEVLARALVQDPVKPDRAIMQHTLGSIAERQAREAAEAAERIERERQERLSSFVSSQITNALIYRTTLRRHFGAGAETNRQITATAVAAYFTAKQLDGTITARELADAIVLDKLFAVLREWNRTDETWTLPWEVVP